MREREALIRLNTVQGLGSVTIHRLLKAFGSAGAVFGASAATLQSALGARYGTEAMAQAIRAATQGNLFAEEAQRAEAAAAQIFTLVDPGYPALLKTIADPPPVLYVRGTLLEEDAAAIAMVGTRSASTHGLEQARRLGMELAHCGVTVVSGLAEGIDAAAHEGALEAGGRTIAVVGHGLQTLYPSFHGELARRIAGSGAVVSEFSMGMPPEQKNFPRRNRVIAGLSLGVLVVEAPEKSGALITAREAMEQGREVFAVPGPVSARTRGTHALLKDGAKLVETAQDILEEVAPQLKNIVRSSAGSERTEPADLPGSAEWERMGLTSEQAQILHAVPTGTAAGLDALAGKAAVAPHRLLSVLTELELKGLVRREPGQGFTRRDSSTCG